MLNIPAGWKPIESAPTLPEFSDGLHRYGPNILVFAAGEVTIARWWQTFDRSASNFIDRGSCAVHPTHWMPLPAAPGSVSPSAPGDAQDEQAAFERWLERTSPSGDVEAVQRQWEASSDYADFYGLVPAPAAGDALDAARYRTVRKSIADAENGANQVAAASDAIGLTRGSYPTPEQFDAIVDHIAAQQGKGGEA